MASGTAIVSVKGRQVFTFRGHPGVEAIVKTENGGTGVAVCTAGVSVGVHEVKFTYDGGTKWRGRGVQSAVDNVNNVIGPALLGMDASNQRAVDFGMLNIGGPGAKERLGGNATAAVSAAVLRAGAAALDIPLYQHIGGVNACLLPVPGVMTVIGSNRYGGNDRRSGGKPTYSLMCYGFDSFADASYAAWELHYAWANAAGRKFGAQRLALMGEYPFLPEGFVKHDRELWDLMVEAIQEAGCEGKVGIQVDVAATTYYEKEIDKYVGLFGPEPLTKDDLFRLYETMTTEYPFVILEDPLEELDLAGHAELTKLLKNVEIVGDDLFTTDPVRLQEGIDAGACNAMLLKVNQIGTITEAFDTVQLAYRHGYGVMPCSSRGEGPEIADYTVGLSAGHLREGSLGDIGNRFLQIEEELEARARFAGRQGLRP